MGTKPTTLGIAVLALLLERPMHPYEMYQLLLDRREDFLIKVRPGSLYHTVDRLTELELVKIVGTERDGGRPERTTYCITPEGTERLSAGVREMLRTPVNEYPQFPVALAEAHNLPREEVIELLSDRVALIETDISGITHALEGPRARGVPEAFWLEGDYVVELRKTEVRLLRRLIKRLENNELPWPYDDPAACAASPTAAASTSTNGKEVDQ
ncbi:PadR family transcriptional regulator [Antricoccus suffuscus]|uniref:PadR family transcriptional regulator n=1 Tax=Antricoccus suffuscus TaxID=1629062 RepID=A0A2T1A723_9ACTN|nr:PadR family transcriptional regulator [Antricoccus suffuscus]PRZ44399.1 PadR family transcriptional regulator [Antricoccus suffuscus]